MVSHPLTNFEIQKYQNEPRFNGVYSRDDWPKKKKKDGTHIINLDECADVDTHWIALYVVNIEILAVLELNMFLKYLTNFLDTKA